MLLKLKYMPAGKLPYFERLMVFASMFSFGVLFYRCLFTLSLDYTFFLWNLLVAYMPYVVSKQLFKCGHLGVKAFLLIVLWLLFLPASIHLFTDMLQMHQTNFSIVFDAFLFLCSAITGILPGLMSLKNVETFLSKHVSAIVAKISIPVFIFLSSYSALSVRFLHLKSWNIVADFKKMLHASENDIRFPENNMHIWISILALVLLIDLLYKGFKRLYQLEKVG